MNDLIRREDVDKAIRSICDLCGEDKKNNGVMCGACNLDSFVREFDDIPSAEPEPEEFEWCHDCKEYDQERHCCHRWTKVIRQTIEELKASERTAKVVHKQETHIVTPPKSTTIAYETVTNLWNECGNCGAMGMYHGWKYCPVCGVKLDWSEE